MGIRSGFSGLSALIRSANSAFCSLVSDCKYFVSFIAINLISDRYRPCQQSQSLRQIYPRDKIRDNEA